jgi:hypothetical protein
VIELWAAFCADQDISFEMFCAGCDALLEDSELWARRGFAALRDHANGR